jgi:hypothetical protein
MDSLNELLAARLEQTGLELVSGPSALRNESLLVVKDPLTQRSYRTRYLTFVTYGLDPRHRHAGAPSSRRSALIDRLGEAGLKLATRIGDELRGDELLDLVDPATGQRYTMTARVFVDERGDPRGQSCNVLTDWPTVIAERCAATGLELHTALPVRPTRLTTIALIDPSTSKVYVSTLGEFVGRRVDPRNRAEIHPHPLLSLSRAGLATPR